ncbi:MAG TPA: WbqC family protein [Methanoregulaceae archaeon]|nr:WbqC family protein [Methanoregulaceae archaeon]
MPYFGYFQKMAQADVFVILDNVQYSKDSYTQRVKIRTQTGWIWLTIPIEKTNNFHPINEVILPEDDRWRKKHKVSIVSNYSKCPYFDKDFIERYYDLPIRSLNDFNEHGIRYLLQNFGIKAKIVRASGMNLNAALTSTDLLLEIVKKLGGSSYISGPSGKQYLDERKFSDNGITVEYFSPMIPEYKQRWPGYQAYMSAIDILFNKGADHCRESLLTS